MLHDFKVWLCYILALHTPLECFSERAFLWCLSRAEIYGRPE